MPLDTSLLGQPVELGQIARELKKLWETSGGTKSRASLVNFAVLCEGAAALETNTKLIADFTREHACRALLLVRLPDPDAPAVEAWINAHCHLSRAGAKQVCCEQVSFLVHSESEQLLSNVLLANLDSDLPLYLWWQGELRTSMDEQLWSSVDRLIFDSRDWINPRAQVSLLRAALGTAGTRLTLCDLNWTRTLHLRQAVAQMFDHPENLALLSNLRALRICHRPGQESTALLFAAWIAAQLGWQSKAYKPGLVTFTMEKGRELACSLEARDGASISDLEVSSEGGSILIQRDAKSAFFRGQAKLNGRPDVNHLLPASSEDLITLLDEELTFGGRHRVYLKTLQALESLLESSL